MLKASMNQIIEWLNQHYVSVGTVIGTVVILIVASIAMLVVNRLLRHWLAYLQGRLHQSDETILSSAASSPLFFGQSRPWSLSARGA